MPRVKEGPKDLNGLLETVYQNCIAKGGDREACSMQSWGAAEKAGWKIDDSGKWVKGMGYQKGDVHVPGAIDEDNDKSKGDALDFIEFDEKMLATGKKISKDYTIFKDGNIYNHKKKGLLTDSLSDNGYRKVWLDIAGERKYYYIHRLVARHYCNNPKKLKEVNHIDGNKENNAASNLEWCDSQQNSLHSLGYSEKHLAELDMEIFASGKWNGDTYSNADLDKIVDSYGKIGNQVKPYLKLGHEDEQKLAKASGMFRDGRPSMGWVESLKREGNKLVAKLKDVPKVIAELIKKRAYKRISSELYINYIRDKQKYPLVLKAVALLGGETPAVTNLQDVLALYAEDDGTHESKTYEFTQNFKEEVEEMTPEEIQAKIEEEKKALSEELEAKFAAEKAELEKKIKEAAKKTDGEDEEAKKKAKEVEDMKKKLSEAEEAHKTEMEKKMSEFEAAKKAEFEKDKEAFMKDFDEAYKKYKEITKMFDGAEDIKKTIDDFNQKQKDLQFRYSEEVEKNKKREVEDFIDKCLGKNKLLPAQKPIVEQVLYSAMESEEVLSFSEKGIYGLEEKMGLYDTLKTLIGSYPDMGLLKEFTSIDKVVKNKGEEAEALISQYMKAHEVDYGQAQLAVAVVRPELFEESESKEI